MKISCQKGYFYFEPQSLTQLNDFVYLTGFSLVKVGTSYTFAFLQDCESFSIKNHVYKNLTAKITYSGEIWDIFDKNGFVYDFELNILRDISLVTEVVDLKRGVNYFFANGLIKPGSLTFQGDKIKSYECYFSRINNQFKYSEVEFV